MLSGYWRSGPGVSRWEFTDRGEVIHILGGELIVEPDGEGPTTLIAGDSAVFPIGWKGTWTVYDEVSKFYVIFAG